MLIIKTRTSKERLRETKAKKSEVVAGRGVTRIYASASGSGVASASPASPDLSPRVVFLLGSGGVV